MRIAIADDLPEDSRKLRENIYKWAEETQTVLASSPVIFESGEALLDSLDKTSFDVIFLDIYMGELNGMETARLIRKKNKNCRLIFTTLTPEFAVESYDVDSSYYLLKPCSYEKLSAALNRCSSSFEPFITVSESGINERLYLCDIAYTEYTNRRVTIHMKNGATRSVSMRQSDLADALLKYPHFCDCMKGILVNFEMVDHLQKDRFLLKDGTYIPISRLKYPGVREQFLEYSYANIRGNTL